MNSTPQQKGVLPRRPITIAALLVMIAASGNALLVGCGGGASQGTDQSATTTETPSTTTETPATDAAAVAMTGEEIYKQRCVLCHGAGGKGDGPGAAGLNPKPRDHTNGAYMKTRTDEDLTSVIKSGKGQMPAWGNILTDDQIKLVLEYTRTLAK